MVTVDITACANLFDIVNTGQHPDASVVEDGEFFCQFLLAGLDHSPRHLLAVQSKCSDSVQKNITNLRSLSPEKQSKKSAVFLTVLDFAHVQIFGDKQLPVLHPPSPCLFFFFGQRDEELS